MRRMGDVSQDKVRVRVDGLDYESMFGFSRLFRSFHMALHPAKLLLAMLLVILLYLGGLAMDLVWGAPVQPGEIDAYVAMTHHDYAVWRAEQLTLTTPAPRGEGIFQKLLDVQVHEFRNLVSSALRLDFGVQNIFAGQGLKSGGVLGALGVMVVATPGWLYETYPAFLGFYLFYAFLLTAGLGGAITRIAAVEACQQRRITAIEGLSFAAGHYHWLILTAIIPFLLVMTIGVLGAVCGAVLFNFPVLDILGGLLLPVFLVGGLAIALIILAMAVSIHVMMPAIAVERVDAFDAIARAVSYSVRKIWRVFFYNMIMIVFGALTYMLVGLVILLTLHVTQVMLGFMAFREVSPSLLRFDAIWPGASGGQMIDDPQWGQLDQSGQIAGAMVLVWVKLLVFLLPAYAFSYYFCAQTWIYLLLRRAADRIGLDYMDEPDDAPPAKAEAPNKVEDAA